MVTAGAQQEMLELAEKIDAPMGCSFMGLSAIPTDTPGFLGMQGMHGHYASSMAMHKADCIIALGARFNDRVTGNKAKFAKTAKIVHLDIDSSELSKNISVTHGLRGNLKSTLRQLLALLHPSPKPLWRQEVLGYQEKEYKFLDHREGMTPRRALLTLNQYLGENTPLATDVGQHQMWTAQTAQFRHSRRFISSGGLGTMGFGLGAAIGAGIGTGERAVLVTGDGSFGMCLQEMATAVHEKVPLVILLLNNGVLGMVRQWQTLFYNKHYSSTILDRQTDFPALARAFGAEGSTVHTPRELEQALAKAFSFDGPYLVNCMIDKDEFVLPMLPPGGSMEDIMVSMEDLTRKDGN